MEWRSWVRIIIRIAIILSGVRVGVNAHLARVFSVRRGGRSKSAWAFLGGVAKTVRHDRRMRDYTFLRKPASRYDLVPELRFELPSLPDRTVFDVTPWAYLLLGITLPLLFAVYLLWQPVALDSLFDQFKVERVEVRAPMQHMSAQELQGLIGPHLKANFFELDLSEMQVKLEAEPWIASVVATRRWPATIDVNIIERTPIARWGELKLIDHYGIVFPASLRYESAELPRLIASERYAVWVMDHYRQMNSVLRKIGQRIHQLELLDNMSWRITLRDGVVVNVDRVDTVDKLQRLVRAYGTLKGAPRELVRVDLRYINGFAVEWADEASNG